VTVRLKSVLRIVRSRNVLMQYDTVESAAKSSELPRRTALMRVAGQPASDSIAFMMES
jgi:hypothetical protein